MTSVVKIRDLEMICEMKSKTWPIRPRNSAIIIAVFCMPLRGHIQRLLPLMSGLSKMCQRLYAFTHEQFQIDVELTGAIFVDLFSKYPLEAADDSSYPFASRYVSFAGHYVEEIVEELAGYQPSLILYDTYAVIGRIVGTLLNVPYINVCAGHSRAGIQAEEARRAESPVTISPACQMAVRKLRNLGFEDVTPFYYLRATSPYLNIYCEPPAFLHPGERGPYQPVVFYGSVSSEAATAARPVIGTPWFNETSPEQLRVFVSFGTVVWLRYPKEALTVLKTLSRTFGELEWVQSIMSLGGWLGAPDHIPKLSRPNVRVACFVDQWSVLQEADVMVTHHGLNSTHEAIFHCVPMISYPFFADQPSLAQRCQELGLAVRLVETLRGIVRRNDVVAALKTVRQDLAGIRTQLTEARRWELEVMASRAGILERVVNLVSRSNERK